jgi:hypothetical protein
MDLSTDNKRFRTSPRTNAFNEVLALIDSQASEWGKNNNSAATAGVAALATLRDKVVGMIGTQHEVEKPATTRVRAPKGSKMTGNHYVAVSQGKVEYVKGTDTSIMIENDPEVVFFGPFQTKAGALYSVEHGTYSQKPQVLSPTA